MALDTLAVVAAIYDDESEAVADYEAVLEVWRSTTVGDTFDAAVVSRRADGKVKIVKRHEEPTLQGGALGAGVGLAVGALAALAPAVAIGTGLLAGGASGLGIGAVAGHVVGGMSRGDLKDLGEFLDRGTSGLLVVAAQDTGARIDEALTRAQERITKALRADEQALEAELEEAFRQARAAG
jgi:uncharacterized membrane protein